MRLALQQLLFILAYRLLLPNFFSTRCCYSVRPRLHPTDPAVTISLPQASIQHISESAYIDPLVPPKRTLFRAQVNSLRPYCESFESLRLSG